MKMAITFIIPSFEQGAFLEEALDSIAAQGLEEGSFEVLVFDGGSRDNTVDVLSKHPVVSFWESVPDRGQGHAINKALRRAKGEIIGWLNSDDYYLPAVLPRVLRQFEEDPELEVLYGRGFEVDALGQHIRELPVGKWSKEAILDACFISQPACFFRKRFAEKNGPLRESLSLTLDYDYWLRASDWMNIQFLSQVLACSRHHENAKSHRCRVLQMKESAILVYEYSGKWRELWLRRVASAKGRQLLDGSLLQSIESLRMGLSALYFNFYRLKIRLCGRPFRL